MKEELPKAGQIDKYSDANWWLWLDEKNEFGRLGHWMSPQEIKIHQAETEIPMGATAWKNHGQQFGYWEYFEKQIMEECRKMVKEGVDF